MNRKFLTFLRKSQFPLILALGTVPVVVLLFAYTAVELLPYAWVFPAAYLILTLPVPVMKGTWRFPYGIAAFALQLVLCGLLVPPENRISALAAAAFYGILLLWSLRFAGWSRGQEITAFWGFFGVIAHLIVQLLRNDPQLKDPEAFAAAGRWLLGAFLLFAVLVMLSMNRGSLWTAGSERQDASVAMRRKNTLLTLGFFALAMLVSLFPAVASGVKTLWFWIVALFGRLARLFETSSQEPDETTGVEQTGDPYRQLGADDVQASRFMEILQVVALAVCSVVLVVLAVCVLRWIGKKLLSLLRRLWTSLGRYASGVAEDYVDEVTDTRDSDTPERLRRKARRRQARPADVHAMAPAERIRWRYRRLTAEHPEWTASATARENLPPELAPLYERARYSDHPMTVEDAERFDSQTQRKPGR